MSNCVLCGHANDDSCRFCGYCGQRLDAPRERICMRCGTANDAMFMYCRNCSAELDDDAVGGMVTDARQAASFPGAEHQARMAPGMQPRYLPYHAEASHEPAHAPQPPPATQRRPGPPMPVQGAQPIPRPVPELQPMPQALTPQPMPQPMPQPVSPSTPQLGPEDNAQEQAHDPRPMRKRRFRALLALLIALLAVCLAATGYTFVQSRQQRPAVENILR